jgi:hypothetical protein
MGVLPRDERRTGGRADGIVVKLPKTDALASQTVQIRGLNFGAVDPEIGESHIVHKDENDIRTVS